MRTSGDSEVKVILYFVARTSTRFQFHEHLLAISYGGSIGVLPVSPYFYLPAPFHQPSLSSQQPLRIDSIHLLPITPSPHHQRPYLISPLINGVAA